MSAPRTAADAAAVPVPVGAPGMVRRRTFGPPGLRSRMIAVFIRIFVRTVIVVWSRVPHLPWPYRLLDDLAALLPPLPGVARRRVRLAHCGAEYSTPRTVADPDGAILYIHGGAFILGGIRTHRRLVSRLVRESHMTALAVDYRRAPRYSVAEALSDCVDGYRWLLDLGYAPDRIAIVGDSAGGYFAFHVAARVSELGLGTPGAVVGQSPLVDVGDDRPLTPGSADPLFTPDAVSAMLRVTRRAEIRSRRRVGKTNNALPPVGSAHQLVLAGFPPALIQVGSGEILHHDAELMANALAEAGVDVELEVWEGQFHVFQAAADLVPEGRRAIENIAGFLHTALGIEEKAKW